MQIWTSADSIRLTLCLRIKMRWIVLFLWSLASTPESGDCGRFVMTTTTKVRAHSMFSIKPDGFKAFYHYKIMKCSKNLLESLINTLNEHLPYLRAPLFLAFRRFTRASSHLKKKFSAAKLRSCRHGISDDSINSLRLVCANPISTECHRYHIIEYSTW